MSHIANQSRADYLKDMILEGAGRLPTELILKYQVSQAELFSLYKYYDDYILDQAVTAQIDQTKDGEVN